MQTTSDKKKLYSDQLIEDVMLRGRMYREIIADIRAGNINTTPHTVALDEVSRADLISYRVYKTPALEWLVDVLAHREDKRDNIEANTKLKFPELAYIRQMIIKYSKG
ncbi:hypothetical protein [Pseudoalteromonas sp. Of7M-16]|uniref:hypothetical protein n=1 Tax=Pseudoalteromonas sp. Of7M-16 TaxID=2917756 RepID=UPI001EF70D1E|nr:hypothetical protein [Pseudoalteromonas sp. Of7M-16]MCG7550967.1 hypothetical protein [Pseudoalteromonas sp. Of7M-16]